MHRSYSSISKTLSNSSLKVFARPEPFDVRTDPVSNIVAGGLGGACSLFVGQPFDTVKVRLQTMRPGRCGSSGMRVAAGALPYAGMVDCAVKIARREGVLAFYRGMAGLMYLSLPRFALIFHGNAVARVSESISFFCFNYGTPWLWYGSRIKIVQ